jgi:hypothetical protein
MPKKTKFKPAKEEPQYEGLSVTTLLGEKDPLMAALNKTEHGYRSFAELNRAALNLMLADLGSDFRLTER